MNLKKLLIRVFPLCLLAAIGQAQAAGTDIVCFYVFGGERTYLSITFDDQNADSITVDEMQIFKSKKVFNGNLAKRLQTFNKVAIQWEVESYKNDEVIKVISYTVDRKSGSFMKSEPDRTYSGSCELNRPGKF